MTIKVTDIDNGGKYFIIEGRFDFSVHKDWMKLTEGITKDTEVVIDLARVDYMDSSAMGMLLGLRSSAKSVVIKSPTEIVGQILKISQFHKLFEIV